MSMKKTDESFKVGGLGSKRRSVGGQGNGGEMSGGEVMGVNNPRGVTPKKIGGGAMPLAQGPVEPKVGK